MSGRLRNIIPLTDTLSILSGYFYFSGVAPLMEPIEENKILKLRILVGLDVDKNGYELAHLGDGASAQEKFKKSLQHYASSKMFDSEKSQILYICSEQMYTSSWPASSTFVGYGRQMLELVVVCRL